MVNLKALVDKDLLVAQQDFQSAETELQRQFQEAMQSGDFAQQTAMAQMLNEFDQVKQQAQQDWQSSENLAQNAFTQQMQMDQNDFQKAMQYIDHELNLAAADDNFEKQQFLMDKQSDLELQMLTQNFNHDEKMAILNTELQQAVADQDVERQKQLLNFSHGLEVQKIEQAQGFEQSMAYLNNELNQALQNNDFANAKVLNELQYEHQMNMHLDDLAIKQATIDLEQQGIDMAQIESEYAKIQDLIAQGQLDPSDAVEFMALQFEDSLPEGFEFDEPDPFAVQKSMREDYINQQYQYALAQGLNPDAIGTFDSDGNFTGLQDSMLEEFNNHLQETLYGQTGTPLQADIIGLKNGDIPTDQITGINDERYQYLLNDVTVSDVGKLEDHNTFSETGSGSDSRTVIPGIEDVKFFKHGEQLFEVVRTDIDDRAGDDDTVYTVRNLLTGQEAKITASEEGSKLSNNTNNIQSTLFQG
jgi:hypothetical protein